MRTFASVVLLAVSVSAGTRFDESAALERAGKLREARDVLRSASAEFRAAADQRSLARSYSVAARISISLGDYRSAIDEAGSAIGVRRSLAGDTGIGEDFNSLGMAYQYLGDYAEALSNYQQALAIGEARGDAEGAITLRNNIGNIYYFEGRYADALRAYDDAWKEVNAAAGARWIPWRRQLTMANLAALYQRLGKEQAALDWYRQMGLGAQALPPGERAQLLANQGVLYRRLGDPVKALELYRAALAIFAKAGNLDAQIGALRNVGTALALDMHDLAGALEAFNQGLELALRSANARGEVLARLYRGETLRQLGRLPEARSDAGRALARATQAGMAEEQWKATYALGRVAEGLGQAEEAAAHYESAVTIIESMRANLRAAALRTEFLADKRDVYDAWIALLLRRPDFQPAEIFRLVERSRARTLRERMDAAAPASEPGIETIQKRLPPDTILLDCWIGSGRGATLWITPKAAGVARHGMSVPMLSELLARLSASIEQGSDDWKPLAQAAGTALLAGIPPAAHIIVVPDGPLSLLPFEVLENAAGVPVVQQSDVTYLPAAQFVASPESVSKWRAPWRHELTAFGDPPVSSADTLAATDQWQHLPASADEVRGIARLVSGRAEVHLGSDARKRHLLDHRASGVPLIHFSTHALVDSENPDRSRLLLAADSPSAGFDYLFQEEVYNLDLRGCALVTVSACDTARGKLVRGEGVQAFSRAFLAAGAQATVTSLWRVPDQPTADFMQQFYYYLEGGQSKAQALRSAKMKFLSGDFGAGHPRYWAAFILTGDGWNRVPHTFGWGPMLGIAAGILALGTIAARLMAARRSA